MNLSSLLSQIQRKSRDGTVSLHDILDTVVLGDVVATAAKGTQYEELASKLVALHKNAKDGRYQIADLIDLFSSVDFNGKKNKMYVRQHVCPCCQLPQLITVNTS